MTNSREIGYFIEQAEENNMGQCMVLTGPWKNAYKLILDRENVSVLRLSQSMGWQDKDISFVSNLTNLRGIEVYAWDIKDISPIQDLVDLEFIGLECGFTKGIDFSIFPNLNICKLRWRAKAKSLFSCSSLRELNVINYPNSDLTALVEMKYLERLQLTSRSLLSLQGIDALKGLQILDLADCLKLESLEEIEDNFNLSSLELFNCKKVANISPLEKLLKLEKVSMENCGNIASLKPLRKNNNLSTLFFIGNTTIDDGDFSELLALPLLKEMWFANKRHYSHTREEIRAILLAK